MNEEQTSVHLAPLNFQLYTVCMSENVSFKNV